MPKAKVKTVVVKCQCNVCKQVAFVEPGKQHFYCTGIKVVKELPVFFRDLKHPDPKRKGTWIPWQAEEAKVQEEIPLAAE